VREKHARLLGRILGALCSRHSQPSTPARHGRVDASRKLDRALDWRAVQAQLSPVAHKWDLAILCHLDDTAGGRPTDLLAAINAETAGGPQLSPQVLSGRLRELEHTGYIRHEDLSVMPLLRVFYLQPLGQALISDLLMISSRR
jgi:DNA-binding HxlR family transcriptional regulator